MCDCPRLRTPSRNLAIFGGSDGNPAKRDLTGGDSGRAPCLLPKRPHGAVPMLLSQLVPTPTWEARGLVGVWRRYVAFPGQTKRSSLMSYAWKDRVHGVGAAGCAARYGDAKEALVAVREGLRQRPRREAGDRGTR
ncbi:hypothetical protein Snoj_39380 [Streptomyces nojiriensis]|uniref:Uncharacterized protein n=1 Tax=Streptomyces nojiriensis TaxID=66374 RepID=A0ABQ3SQC7_9ACTN|nr:hypothetical protein GCM10010205_08030 [Streptomyces nojiriensis]GHI70020.1 hypothetical protein Snoj_39380 [Streptomyces nojiriensis]